MITLTHSVTINRPLEQVFSYVTDIEKGSEWQTGVLEAESPSEGPVGIGSTTREVRQFMGRRMESTFEVTEYEPNSAFGFKSTSGPIPMKGRQTFETVEGGTKVTFVLSGEPEGAFKLAAGLIKGMAKRQIEADYSNLKDLLESQG